MNIQFSNLAKTQLQNAISTIDTAIVVVAGGGALFPALTAGKYFYATLQSVTSASAREIVKCIARSSDTLTVTRAQGGTIARAFQAGDYIALGWTAEGVADSLDQKVGRLNVLNLGAVGDGSTDDTAAITAALATAGASGRGLYFPAATYQVSGEMEATSPVRIYGDGPDKTIIRTTSATANCFKISASHSSVEGFGFESTVTRTGGAYVYLNASNTRLSDFHMVGAFNGVYNNAGSTVRIQRGLIFNTATNGTGIWFTGGTGSNDLYVDNVTMSGDANDATRKGIRITDAGAVNITNCDIIRHGIGLEMDPGNGQSVPYVYVLNSYFDTGTAGIRTNSSGTGFVQGLRAVGCWFGSNTGNGCALNGTVYGAEFIGCHAFSNSSNGLTINASAVEDVSVIGGAYCGNTGSGVNVVANASNWQVIGARIGDGYAKPGNAYGIFVAAGTSNNYRIIGNDLTGNTTTALSDAGTGTSKNIHGNTGLSPGATSAITVTASPFTYTAGNRPETVYIAGGTVTNVQVDGTNTFAASNVSVRLGAMKAVVVTYTVAPTMFKTID